MYNELRSDFKKIEWIKFLIEYILFYIHLNHIKLCTKIYILINRLIKIYEIKLLFNVSIISYECNRNFTNTFFFLEIQFVIGFKVLRKVSYSHRIWRRIPLFGSSGKHFVIRYRLCLEKKFGWITVYQDICTLSRMISLIRPIRTRITNVIAVNWRHVWRKDYLI